MRSILTIYFFLLTIFSFAQTNNINCKDSLGRKQGIWRYWYPDGKLSSEVNYRNDSILYELQLWKNGTKWIEVKHINKNNINLITTHWDTSGIKTSINIQYKEKDSEHVTYWYPNGNMKSIKYVYNKKGFLFFKPKKDYSKSYFEDGNLKETKSTIWHIIRFKNDNSYRVPRKQTSKLYHSNGKPSEVEKISNYKKTRKNRRKVKKHNYKKTVYYTNGKKKMKIKCIVEPSDFWTYNIKRGKKILWDPNGKVILRKRLTEEDNFEKEIADDGEPEDGKKKIKSKF